MQKGPKLPSSGKKTDPAANENASRLANRTITEEPAKEDNETNYNNSLERMGQNIDCSEHFHHHYDPKIKRKAATANADLNADQGYFPDKLEVLKDQNMKLKSHHKELEEQVKIIATKLKRQITQLKKDRVVGGKTTFTAQFEQDLDGLIEENIKLQNEEQELMQKVKKLQKQRRDELTQGKNLYSVAEEHLIKRSNKVEQDQLAVINSLKVNIEKSNKQILQLKLQVESGQRIADNSLNIQDLMAEKRNAELKLMQARSRLEDVRANLRVKEDIFKQGKGYEEQLFNQLKSLQEEQTQLQATNRMLETSASQNDDLRARLTAVKMERDKMQAEFDKLMKQPFFKQEADHTNLGKLEKLQNSLDVQERDIAKSKTAILKFDTEVSQATSDLKKVINERDQYQDEIAKMKAHMDPSSLTLNDVMKKLNKEDPSRFREVMKDLEYQGKDPNWFQIEFMEQLNLTASDNAKMNPQDLKSLRQHRDRLVDEKAKLATELSRIQNLLKLQVDIDKQSSQLLQTELNQVQSQIRGNTKRQTELNQMITTRNQRLLTLQKAGGPGLTKGDLDRFNKEVDSIRRETQKGNNDDAVSEFSVITDESEIQARENLLDLRISTASFDRVAIMQVMGGRELLPSHVQTFLSVDFYNHDSKHTDLTEGFEPVYNTLFSFKNTVDDFYMKFLEKDTILVDIFSVPPKTADNSRTPNALKVGSAKLPLHKLLEKDFSFQAQEIYHETQNGKVKVGKIFFRMRMRKPLDEALKWYNHQKQIRLDNSQSARLSKVDQNVTGGSNSKIVEITVSQGSNLQIQGTGNNFNSKRMLPFFSYDFYTFEVRSATAQGHNPLFESTKQFQVEGSPQFLQYMKSQVLTIDLIDESVDMTVSGMRDYIGSVRIPLREVIIKGAISGTFAVIDEQRRQTGDLTVKIVMKDADSFEDQIIGVNMISQSTKIQGEVLRRTAIHFAQSGFEDLDLLFDILFLKDNSQSGKVTKEMFKDFVFSDLKMAQVTERDLDLLMKTHPGFAGKTIINRQDLRGIFDGPFKEAREAQTNEQSRRPDMTTYGSRQQQSRMKQTNAFGYQDSPARPAQNPFNQSTGGTSSQPLSLVPQQTSGTFEASESYKKLKVYIKENLYRVINKFQEEVGQDQPGATEKQTVHVLSHFGSESDAVQFFHEFKVNELIYYRDTLSMYFGKTTVIPKIKRSTSMQVNLNRIKKLLLEYMVKNNLNVDEIFAVLSKKNQTEIGPEDFTNAFKQKLPELSEEDVRDLFRAIDIDKSGRIDLNEVKLELANVNAAMVLRELKNTKKTVEDLFKIVKQGSDDDKLMINQFAELINLGVKTTPKDEIDILFKAVDKSHKGYLTKADLKNAMAEIDSVLQANVVISPKDLFMPLLYKITKRLSLGADAVFQKFRDPSAQKVGPAQFALMFKHFVGVELLDEETALIDAWLSQNFASNQLSLENLRKLFMTEFRHQSLGKGDQKQALETFAKIKNQLKSSGKELVSEFEKFQSEVEVSGKEINLRSFKHMMEVVCSLSNYEFENMVEFLDTQNQGYLKLVDIQKQLL